MQAWGGGSRFGERDTGPYPTKSGILGLCAAALGVAREDERALSHLAQLALTVRIDRPGTIARDFHTAGGGSWPGRKRFGVYKASGKGGDTAISQRYYLADASFACVLQGEPALVRNLDSGLRDPVWPVFLGRKAFVPAAPLALGLWPDGDDALAALRTVPLATRPDVRDGRVRCILEADPNEGLSALDVPVSFRSDSRQYAQRFVREEWLAAFPAEEA